MKGLLYYFSTCFIGLIPCNSLEEGVEALGSDGLQGAEDGVAAVVIYEVLCLRNL